MDFVWILKAVDVVGAASLFVYLDDFIYSLVVVSELYCNLIDGNMMDFTHVNDINPLGVSQKLRLKRSVLSLISIL